MNKLTLKTDAIGSNKRKDGTLYMSKEVTLPNGKKIPSRNYWVVNAETIEEGKISWFANEEPTLKAGDIIEGTLEITTSEKDGKTYTNKNFKFPKKNDLLEDRVSNLEKGFADFRREMEMKFAELKSDLTLDLLGKFNTSKDFNKINEEYGTILEPEF